MEFVLIVGYAMLPLVFARVSTPTETLTVPQMVTGTPEQEATAGVQYTLLMLIYMA